MEGGWGDEEDIYRDIYLDRIQTQKEACPLLDDTDSRIVTAYSWTEIRTTVLSISLGFRLSYCFDHFAEKFVLSPNELLI